MIDQASSDPPGQKSAAAAPAGSRITQYLPSKEVLIEMVASGDSPDTIIEKKGWKQVADPDALTPAVEETLDAFPDKVAAYRAGRKGLMGFFMGQVMQRTGGTAKPELARKLLEEKLGG